MVFATAGSNLLCKRFVSPVEVRVAKHKTVTLELSDMDSRSEWKEVLSTVSSFLSTIIVVITVRTTIPWRPAWSYSSWIGKFRPPKHWSVFCLVFESLSYLDTGLCQSTPVSKLQAAIVGVQFPCACIVKMITPWHRVLHQRICTTKARWLLLQYCCPILGCSFVRSGKRCTVTRRRGLKIMREWLCAIEAKLVPAQRRAIIELKQLITSVAKDNLTVKKSCYVVGTLWCKEKWIVVYKWLRRAQLLLECL